MGDVPIESLIETIKTEFVGNNGKISPWIDQKIDPRMRDALVRHSSFIPKVI